LAARLSTPKHSSLHYARRITRAVVRHPANEARRGRALSRAIGWQLYKRVVRRPLEISYAGFRLRCYPDSHSASNIFYFGALYDWHEMRFLQRYLRPGDGFVDVGANIGTYTLLAASLVGPRGGVDAFEPSPVAAGRLRESVELNQLPNVCVHEAAIGDTNGTIEFSIGWDVTDGVYTPADRYQQLRPRIEVELARLDDVLADRPYAAAKLDVEGLELAALRGAVAHLEAANPPVWQIEVLANQLRKFGASVNDLFAFLRERGYDLFIFDSASNELINDASALKAASNVLAIAHSHLDDVVSRINERRQIAGDRA
jgi:FkbM family methyltransferase